MTLFAAGLGKEACFRQFMSLGRCQRSMSCTQRAEPLPDVLSARGECALAPVNQTEHPSSPFPFIRTWSQLLTGKSCPRDSPSRWEPGFLPGTLLPHHGAAQRTFKRRKRPNVRCPHLSWIFWQRGPMTSFLPMWAVWTINTSALQSTPHTGDVMPGPTHRPPNVDVLLIGAEPGHGKHEHRRGAVS